jgi:4'-phosphopantetheinyl transferase EntD
MPDLQALVAAARALLPPGVAVAAADPGILHPLWPGESLPGAVPRRLAEFSAGRAAARQALEGLGLPGHAIPQGPDRAPIWPAGLTGSITHSTTACLAAARRGPGGLGLDLEPDQDLLPDLWDEVLSRDERRWAEMQDQPGRAARLVFSAKEAAFKAQYPLTRQVFGFDMLAVVIAGGAFAARFRYALGPFAADDVVCGHHTRAEGHILTACTL